MSESFKTPPRGKLLWLAVDLDDTLAKGVWDPETLDTGIGPPKYENVQKMVQAWEAGFKIVIHTSRPWHDYEMIESWLENHSHYDFLRGENYPLSHYVKAIQCGKLLAAAYIDDRAIHESERTWIPFKNS